MPIFDAGDYSQLNTYYLIPLIVGLSKDDKFFEKNSLFYFNIYLGDKYVGFENGKGPVHFCRNMDYGFLFSIFHNVLRQDVLGSNVMFPDYLDSCVTLLWTASNFQDNHVDVALKFADEAIRNIEFATGKPCPIALGESQHATNFEIAHVKVMDKIVDRISLQSDRRNIPILTKSLGPILEALMGFDPEYNKEKEQAPFSFISVAARWQQKAIRAYGSGEYTDCVVCSSIWAETFLVQVTAALIKLYDGTTVDLRLELGRGLPRYLNKFLGSKILKGNWDHTNINTEVGKWYANSYTLRNKVAHEGIFPTKDQAFNCYETTHEFVRSVSKQIGGLKDTKYAPLANFFQTMMST